MRANFEKISLINLNIESIEYMTDVKAVLFDLDGVLVDTLHYHYLGWQKMFSDLGAKISEHTVLLHEGRNSREILPILLDEANVVVPALEHDKFIEGKRSHYRKIVDVSRLKASGLKVAIVTACSQKTMESSLSKEHRKLFDLIQTGDDVPRAKPNPDPYDLARKKLGFKKNECIIVENAPLGIESAKAAGMTCVAVETTLGAEYLGEADYIVSDIKEILELPVLEVL